MVERDTWGAVDRQEGDQSPEEDLPRHREMRLRVPPGTADAVKDLLEHLVALEAMGITVRRLSPRLLQLKGVTFGGTEGVSTGGGRSRAVREAELRAWLEEG